MSKELKQVKELAKDIQEQQMRLRQKCKKLDVLTTEKAEMKVDCDSAYWNIKTLIRVVNQILIKEAKNE